MSRLLQLAAVRAALLGIACASMTAVAQSPVWKPSKPVEIIVGVSPGGGIDRTARLIQKILQERKLVDVAASVVNKPGGGGTIAQSYMNLQAGDAHYWEISATSLLTNDILGKTKLTYRDFTPIAMLYDEYIGLAVRADSPIKSGKDLLAAFKANPEAIAIGIATSAGNTNHIAAAMVAKAAGADVRKLKVVVFGSGGESMTALLGGHVGLVATPSANLIPHLQAGRMRVLAVAAPRRLEGGLATVPTWKEQGVDAVVANWRPAIGPKGWSSAQIAYWEDVLGKLVQTEDWRAEVERAGGVNNYMKSRELLRFFESQHAVFTGILTEIGLVK